MLSLSDRESFDKKGDALERKYEEKSLMLNKNQEIYRVFEEVFDHITLQAVYKLIKQKHIQNIEGVIKAGKEARVYWGKNLKGEELAIKIYYTATAEFRKGMMQYIQGDPRFNRIQRSTRGIIYTWTQKEYKNLQLAERAGVNSPRPRAFQKNILVMTFIGDEGEPAPLLRETNPDDPRDFYIKLLSEIRLLYTQAGLVHGDLSEYNIMVWDNAPVIFDVSQAMLISHPLAESLIQRDIANVNNYFIRLDVEVIDEEVLEMWVKGESESLS